MLQQRIAEFPAKTMVDVLRWKQIENPMADAPLIVVGVDHGRVVATRTAYAMDWRFGNHPEPVRSAVFGGTVVAKSHEGQGLVRKMTDKLFALARARELAFGINLSPGRVVAGSSLRSGWVPVGPWDVLVRPKEGNQDAGQPVFPEPSECVSLSSRNGIGLCLGRGRYQEMAELDASCLHGNTISCWKTPEYFSWRLSNSITDYRVIYADRKGLQGYAVLGAGNQAGSPMRS